MITYCCHYRDSIVANTSRISGAQIIRCKTQKKAQEAFDRELDAGRMEKVEVIVNRVVITRDMVPTGSYVVNGN